MKRSIVYYALSLGLTATALADPLDKSHVSADAKWLIHVDCDNLRQTQVGQFLVQKFLAPKLEEAAEQMKLNLSNVVDHIGSLTAFGTKFTKGAEANAVLLINTDAETQKVLEGVFAAQMLADTNGPVHKLESPHNIYSIADQVFVSPQKGGPVVVSKSQEQLEATRELLAGKGPSLTSAKTFAEYPTVSNSFFFLGVADVFDGPNPLPAQAKVLQMAEGGRVALGEKADQVFLDLTLRGKTAEVTRQIQQVVEGMVALVSLGQPENPELMDLAKSAKVTSTDQLISLNLEYPAPKLIARIEQEMAPKAKPAKPAKKAKAKKQPKPEKRPAATDEELPETEPAPAAKPAPSAKPAPEAESK